LSIHAPSSGSCRFSSSLTRRDQIRFDGHSDVAVLFSTVFGLLAADDCLLADWVPISPMLFALVAIFPLVVFCSEEFVLSLIRDL